MKTWTTALTTLILLLPAALPTPAAANTELDRAEQQLRAELDADPTDADALVDLANLYLVRNEPAAALEAARAATREAPGDATAWNTRGVAHLQLGQPGEAIDCYVKAIQADPEGTTGLINLARLNLAVGNPGPARKLYLHVLDREPMNVEANFEIGRVFAGEGQHFRAISFFATAERAAPENVDVLLAFGKSLVATGQYEAVAARADRALERNPQRQDVRQLAAVTQFLLGVDAERRDDLAAARRYYEAAIARQPGYESPYHNLGILDVAAGHPTKAIATYERALAFHPGSAQLWLNLYVAHVYADQTEPAGVYWQKLKTLAKDHPHRVRAERFAASR